MLWIFETEDPPNYNYSNKQLEQHFGSKHPAMMECDSPGERLRQRLIRFQAFKHKVSQR
jgi:hypothetical protein